MSVLSTNNSDSFLQNLAHIDQRDRERQDRREQDDGSGGGQSGGGGGGGGGGSGSGSGSGGGGGGGSTKPEDMLLLEKQGRCSQKLRSNQLSNLAHVTQTVGQNMTDISNIGGNKIPKMLSNMGGNQQPPSAPTPSQPLPPRKDNRGSSLPPSALPRPPRSLKPPRKIEYGRLSDSEGKKRAETPPTPGAMDAQKEFEMKTSSLKRGGFAKGREFSPGKSYVDMKDAAMHLAKDYGGTLKSKNYGSLGNTSSISGGGSPTKSDGKFGFGGGMKSSGMAANSCEFSKPDYTSTKNYQRLEEQGSSSRKNSTDNMKRSLLPNVRKLSSGGAPIMIKGSRDSLNSASSGSNNSNNRTSPMHPASSQQGLQQLGGGGGYHHHNHLHHGRTPPRFIHHQQSTSAESSKSSSNLPSPTTPTGNLPQPFFNNNNNNAKMAPKPQQHKPSTLPSASILHAAVTASATSAIGQQTTASLPPKPGQQQQQQQPRRGSSLTRGENKYRIQF